MEIYNYLLVPPKDGKCTVQSLSPGKTGKMQTDRPHCRYCSTGADSHDCMPLIWRGYGAFLTTFGTLPHCGILGTSKFVRQEALPTVYDNANLNFSPGYRDKFTRDSAKPLRAWLSTLTPMAIECIKSFRIELVYTAGRENDVADACRVLATFLNMRCLSIRWWTRYNAPAKKDMNMLAQPLQILRTKRECEFKLEVFNSSSELSLKSDRSEKFERELSVALEKYRGKEWWGLGKWARPKEGGRLVSR